MFDNLKQNLIGTRGIFDEKPIIAELISNGKPVPAKLKIKPHFDYAVRDKFGYLNIVEFFGMFVNLIKKHDFGQINKMP